MPPEVPPADGECSPYVLAAGQSAAGFCDPDCATKLPLYTMVCSGNEACEPSTGSRRSPSWTR